MLVEVRLLIPKGLVRIDRTRCHRRAVVARVDVNVAAGCRAKGVFTGVDTEAQRQAFERIRAAGRNRDVRQRALGSLGWKAQLGSHVGLIGHHGDVGIFHAPLPRLDHEAHRAGRRTRNDEVPGRVGRLAHGQDLRGVELGATTTEGHVREIGQWRGRIGDVNRDVVERVLAGWVVHEALNRGRVAGRTAADASVALIGARHAPGIRGNIQVRRPGGAVRCHRSRPAAGNGPPPSPAAVPPVLPTRLLPLVAELAHASEPRMDAPMTTEYVLSFMMDSIGWACSDLSVAGTGH